MNRLLLMILYRQISVRNGTRHGILSSVKNFAIFTSLNDLYMKRMLLILLSVLCAFPLSAQFVPQFKGHPVDGTMDEFVKLLEDDGFVLDEPGTVAAPANVYLLTGTFAGYDNCQIIVMTSQYTSKVMRVSVFLPENEDWASLKSNYFTIKEMYTSKYGEGQSDEYFSGSYEDGDGKEIEAVKSGNVTLSTKWDEYNGMEPVYCLMVADDTCIMILYTNPFNYAEDEAAQKAAALNEI
jgi:hypothetical protein